MAERALNFAPNLLVAAIGRLGEQQGYGAELEELKSNVSRIRTVVLNSERQRYDTLSKFQKILIRKLKDIMYDADDVIDEIQTLSGLGELRRFGKRSNQIHRDVRDIKERIEAISSVFHLVDDVRNYEYKNRVRDAEGQETCSYVRVVDIIGRDKDKEAIVNSLLDPNAVGNVSFLSIVGVGGVGKTALAQLVFNDDRIRHEFSDPAVSLWISLSDRDDLRDIAYKILVEITGQKLVRSLTMDEVLKRVLEKLEKSKYLLVLDGAWDDNIGKCRPLYENLLTGQQGSRILVTTRLQTTTFLIAGNNPYMLQRLSKEESWRLFEMSAFTKGSEEENRDELVQIGKNIVEKCFHIPLCIKVVGDLLIGQPISEWRAFEDRGLAKIGVADNKILRSLMLSYHNLDYMSKSCFKYCAILPKNVEIRKEMIIAFWIAQEYVVLEDRSVEDVADEVFSMLLRRCFFQDVVMDEYGDVESFKIHDLMHYVAQEAGKEEICNVTSITDSFGGSIRHVHHFGDPCQDITLDSKKMRSYSGNSAPFFDTPIDNWRRLRVLELSWCDLRCLPDTIGKLLHLRYLGLSHNNNLEVLCDSTTKLHNLQTLDLYCCRSLKELPTRINNLVKLRHLNLEKCDSLTCMPLEMDKLHNLRVLPLFVVGNSLSREKQSCEGMLKDLKSLRMIKGKICIKIGNNYENVEDNNGNEGGYLKTMKYLRNIRVEFKDDATCSYDPETVLDNLEPPPNLKGISLHNHKGTRIGRWGRAEHNWTISLPHLVHIEIWKCRNLQQMPILSELPNLKTLSLFCLDSLEYMANSLSSSSRETSIITVFPALETLNVMWMEQLKGWWKGHGAVDEWGSQLRFPHLSYLKIYKCPNLMSFVPCPSSENMPEHELPCLKTFKISYCPKLALNLICPIIERLEVRECERLQINSGNPQDYCKGEGRHVEVDKVGHLNFLTMNFLTRLCIHGDSEVEYPSIVENAFQCCASTLQELEIRFCANLRLLSGLENLCALKELKLLGNNQLSIHEDEEEPWKSFHQTLLHLKFDALPKMTALPKGLHYFTALQILELRWCENLELLPDWMDCFSSLKSLSIIHCPRIKSLPEAIKDLSSLKNLSIQHGCPELINRCKIPNGEDFPKIQHIDNISIWPII